MREELEKYLQEELNKILRRRHRRVVQARGYYDIVDKGMLKAIRSVAKHFDISLKTG